MATAVNDLLVRIDATTEQLRRELRRADQSVSQSATRIDRRLARVDAAFDRIGAAAATANNALGMFGVAIGGAALVNFTRDAFASTAELGRMARALGVSAEEIQELSYTFRQFGADSNDVADALATLADRSLDAVGGAKSMQDDFALVGLSIEDLRGKDPSELFRTFADAVASTQNPTERTAAVVRTLGDDLGRKLMPLLMKGAQGLDDYADAARRTGKVLREDLVESAEEVDKKFKDLTETISTAFKRSVVNWAQFFGMDDNPIAEMQDELDSLVGKRDRLLDIMLSGRSPTGRTLSDEQIGLMRAEINDLNNQILAAQQNLQKLLNPPKEDRDPGPIAVEVVYPSQLADIERQVEQQRRLNAALAEGAKAHLRVQQAIERENAVAEFRQQLVKEGISGVDEHVKAYEEQYKALQKLQQGYSELEDAQERGKEFADQLGLTFSSAFEDAIVEMESFRDVVNGLLEDILRIIVRMQITRPMAEAIGTGIGNILPNANGNAFADGRVIPFASGGVVTGPTLFPMRGATGLMGEAGPEAIMPLKRGSDGKLGVAASGGAEVNVIVQNIDQSSGGTQVETTQQRSPDGSIIIRNLIRDEMKTAIGSGALDRTFAQTYGMKRRGL